MDVPHAMGDMLLFILPLPIRLQLHLVTFVLPQLNANKLALNCLYIFDINNHVFHRTHNRIYRNTQGPQIIHAGNQS